jgi:hypothetical protein
MSHKNETPVLGKKPQRDLIVSPPPPQLVTILGEGIGPDLAKRIHTQAKSLIAESKLTFALTWKATVHVNDTEPPLSEPSYSVVFQNDSGGRIEVICADFEKDKS